MRAIRKTQEKTTTYAVRVFGVAQREADPKPLEVLLVRLVLLREVLFERVAVFERKAPLCVVRYLGLPERERGVLEVFQDVASLGV